MSKEVEIIKEKELPEVKQVNAISLPDGMLNDAFTALCLSILGEFFMSGDTKYFIFQGMLSNLKEKGYSEEDMNKFGIRNVDNTSDTNVSFERYDCVKGLRCNDFSDKDCNDFKEGTYEFGFGCTKLFLIAIVLAFVIYVIIDNIKTKN